MYFKNIFIVTKTKNATMHSRYSALLHFCFYTVLREVAITSTINFVAIVKPDMKASVSRQSVISDWQSLNFSKVSFCFAFPFMVYNRYSYAYNDKRIVIKKGVIFKYEIIIPVCQIQDLHLLQGPLMQLMKLQSVEISTAGSNYTINGLTYDDAKKMVDELEKNLNKRIEELKNEEVF